MQRRNGLMDCDIINTNLQFYVVEKVSNRPFVQLNNKKEVQRGINGVPMGPIFNFLMASSGLR